MSFTLRPYQSRVIEEIFDWFGQHPDADDHPVVSACVGSGKSIMIAEFIRRVMTAWPDQRILMAVHSRELVRQNADKIKAIWPQAPLGIHSAGLGKSDCYHQIIFASIGSIWKKAMHLGRFDLLLVDECHAISSKADGMYRKLIADMQRINPKFRVIGFTGTPFRGNGVWLWEGEDPLFTGLASDVPMDEMLQGGYLVPLVNSQTQTTIDASGIKVDNRTGDYVISDLARIADDADVIRRAVAEIVRKAADRRSWLVYCVTVDHAEHVRDEIRSHGIDCEMVTGMTPKAERDAILSAFTSHRLRCIVNVAVLTTGFDHPATDMIALLRNTRSPVLMTQIAGRGMRTAQGKSDCLFLDFTDSTEVLGPINKITGRPWRKPAEGGEAATKQCPQCLAHGAVTRVPVGVTECPECGHQFEIADRVNHDATASNAVLIAPSKSAVTVYPVTNVRYLVHKKPGSPDSMRVDYYSGLRRIASEWVCFDHSGYAREKAVQWLRRHIEAYSICYDSMSIACGVIPTTAQAVDLATRWARHPDSIAVDESGKYPEIRKIIYEEAAA